MPSRPQRNPQLRRLPRQRRLVSNVGIGIGEELFSTPANLGVTGRIQSSTRLYRAAYPFHGDEEVANIAGTAGFGVTQFPINPGQSSMFPWLSRQAILYERYKFTQLEFYYKTTTNQFVATSVGKVVYNVDFDASDPPPVSKQQAMDSEPAVSCAPYENMQLTVPQSDLNSVTGWRYVRPGGLPGGGDIKTFDVGNLNVVTDSNGGTAAIGELHVRYAGVFKDRVLEATSAAPINYQAAWFQSTTYEAMVSTVNFQPLMATATANGINAVNTAGSIVLPAGNYLFDYVTDYGFSADAQAISSILAKNGTNMMTTAQVWAPSGAGDTFATISGSAFGTSNGTDAFTLRCNATFAAGTGSVAARLRIIAI